MKKILLICILLLFVNDVKAQQHMIDSLNKIIIRVNDKEKAKLYNQMAVFYWLESLDSSIIVAELALKLSKKTNNIKQEIFAYNNLSMVYNFMGNIDGAEKYIKISENMSKKYNDSNGLAYNYLSQGLYYINKSDFYTAIKYTQNSLFIGEKLKDTFIIRNANHNIGTFYNNSGDHDNGYKYTYMAFKISKIKHDIVGLIFSGMNLIEIHVQRHEDNSALFYAMFIDTLMQQYSFKFIRDLLWNNIGVIYKKLNKIDKAIDCFEKSIENISGSMNNVTESPIYLAEIYAKLNNKSKTTEYLKFCFNILDDVKSDYWKKTLFETASDIYANWKDYKKAYYYIGLAKRVNDSVFNQNKGLLTQLETKIVEDKKKGEVLLLQKQNEIKNLELQRSNQLATSAIIGFILLIGVSFIIFRERRKSEKLLLNILPKKIAGRLKKKGVTTIADGFSEASVIFIDIAGFTNLSSRLAPEIVVEMLNNIFTKFDKISAKYGIEKIKTIGDCYMAAAGIPEPIADHAEAITKMAIEIMETVDNKYEISNEELGIVEEDNSSFLTPNSSLIRFRIGLDCGPVVAGVIGEQKFIYDLWGDTVNTASRMESSGLAGKIQCTKRFKDKLGIRNEELGIIFEERGVIEIKGKGKMRTWFLKTL